MKKFDVEITETLQRTVTVEAASQEEAERMVDRGWRDGDYVLTDEDYVGVDFKTTGEHELSEKKMLDVLLVKPNEHPQNISIGAELKDLQEAVGGSIDAVYPFADPVAIIRIVCYDIKELGKQMKKLGMLIVQDQVWGRVTANRSSGKSTRYYMDEMHLLLKEEQTAAYSVEIWKRFRKWGGIPTGLTQNVKDLLSSREVENIFENSDMIIMLNQAAGDRQILAKQLNISPHQLSYVTHSGEGEGLLFFGNVILPFVDRFPTDLELYRIMTTKLGEVSEGAQK